MKRWLEQHAFSVIDWPSCSPDLNPIENLWSEVKKKAGAKNYKNLDELFEAIEIAWYSIPIEYCQKLIKSMDKRCNEVIKNNGFPTKY